MLVHIHMDKYLNIYVCTHVYACMCTYLEIRNYLKLQICSSNLYVYNSSQIKPGYCHISGSSTLIQNENSWSKDHKVLLQKRSTMFLPIRYQQCMTLNVPQQT